MKTKGWMLAGLMAATAMTLAAPAQAQEQGRQGNGRSWQGQDGSSRGERGTMRGNWNSQQQQQRQQSTAPQARTVPAERDRSARWQGQPQPSQRVVSPSVNARQDVRSDSRQDRRDWRQDGRDIHQDSRSVRQDQRDVRNDRNDWRNDRRDVRQDNRTVRQDQRDWRNDRNDRNDWRNDRRPGSDNRWNDNRGRLDARTRWSDQRRWDNGWRNDRRYDWQGYRSRYRNIYHMPRYYAPSGWNYGYRSFSIGVFLNNGFYSDNYWLDDPYRYRLPPAYGSMRWIRYYDDALLVDIRDGYVVDVIRNFFW